jgi:hypothetical protein
VRKKNKATAGEWTPTVYLRWSVNEELEQKWTRSRTAWNPTTQSDRRWTQEEWRPVPDENPLAGGAP